MCRGGGCILLAVITTTTIATNQAGYWWWSRFWEVQCITVGVNQTQVIAVSSKTASDILPGHKQCQKGQSYLHEQAQCVYSDQKPVECKSLCMVDSTSEPASANA